MQSHEKSPGQIEATAQKIVSYSRKLCFIKVTLNGIIKQHVTGEKTKQTHNNIFKLKQTKLYPS